jgi:hypothetical protein
MNIHKISTNRVFYPILFGLYPVLFLISVNLGEIPFEQSRRAIFVVFLASLVLWALLKLVTKDKQKSALISTVLLLSFFSYGHIYNFLGQADVFSGLLGRHRYLFPLAITIILTSTFWIIKKAHNLHSTSRALNLIGVVLISLPVFQIATFEIRTVFENKSAQISHGKYNTNLTLNTNEAPDIYYIILDAYGREDTLLELYDYDNSSFISDLQNMGFYVADCSVSNYEKTIFSLPTTLNMNYLDKLGGDNLKRKSAPLPDSVKFKSLFSNNEARRFLEANGYTIVAFQTGFYWASWHGADYYFSYRQNNEEEAAGEVIHTFLNEFESLLLQSSTGLLFIDLLNIGDLNSGFDSVDDQEFSNSETQKQIRYNTVNFTLDMLEDIPKSIRGPKFVYAHVVSPHPPYVFNPNGDFVADQDDVNQGYPDQISFINQRVLAIVENIIQSSEIPTIIILQGDHGPPETESTAARMEILNAYYLPDGGNFTLYSSITPVNSFRLIFDQYFGTKYGLLDDVSWRSVDFYRNPFKLEMVPNTCEGK